MTTNITLSDVQSRPYGGLVELITSRPPTGSHAMVLQSMYHPSDVGGDHVAECWPSRGVILRCGTGAEMNRAVQVERRRYRTAAHRLHVVPVSALPVVVQPPSVPYPLGRH